MKRKNIKHSFIKLTAVFFLLMSYYSCGDKSVLSEDVALSSVENYLKSNPIYETAELEIGEVKFRSKNDQQKLETYKTLSSKGYVELVLAKQKKKFLSKDTASTYEVKLTTKMAPFVVQQKDEKVRVRTVEYILDEKEKKGIIELSGKSTGNITVNLKRVDTDLAILENKTTYAPFASKTFKLKFNKEKGWEVTKVK